MRAWLRWSVLAAALLSVSCARKQEVGVTAYQAPDQERLQARTFESLLTIVDEKYVYEGVLDSAWRPSLDDYRDRLQDGIGSAEFGQMMAEMLAQLPDGTAAYQSRGARLEGAMIDDRSYAGIGAFVSARELPEPRLIILFAMPGSPAERAGLMAHDAILSIDGEPVGPADLADQIGRVRGPTGTDLSLKVRSPGQQAREVVVTRDEIELAPYRLAWDTIGDSKAGYFLFPPANYEQLLEDFILGLRALDAAGDLEGLILDLRIVSGTGDWPVGSLLTLFTEGEVGEFYSREQTNPVAVSGVDDFLDSQELPLVLIVGPTTTGSAEIFAATLLSAGKAIVVGQPTSGRVETISTFHLPDGSQAFVATTSYRPGTGLELGLEGITPDIPVDADWDEVTRTDDPAVEAALTELMLGGD